MYGHTPVPLFRWHFNKAYDTLRQHGALDRVVVGCVSSADEQRKLMYSLGNEPKILELDVSGRLAVATEVTLSDGQRPQVRVARRMVVGAEDHVRAFAAMADVENVPWAGMPQRMSLLALKALHGRVQRFVPRS